MSEERPTDTSDQGLTRRELLRKGAVLGGALAWSIPTVQTIRMAPAFAAATSFAISYVAVVVRCGEQYFRGKWEVVDGSTSLSFEEGGSLPCDDNNFTQWPNVTYTPGSPPGGGWITDYDGTNVTISVSSDCVIVWTLNKCGSTCIESGGVDAEVGGHSVTFTPCPNPNA